MEMKKIDELLGEISRGHILLPEFQRGYVWRKNQVRGLVQSLYREHPTGHLLIWRTIRPPLVRGRPHTGRGRPFAALAGRATAADHALRPVQRKGAAVLRRGETLFRPLFQHAD